MNKELTFKNNKVTIKLLFDFSNSLIYVNNKKLKVENDTEYTYKILKTKIKSCGGIGGLYNFFASNLSVQNTFYCDVKNALYKIIAYKEV